MGIELWQVAFVFGVTWGLFVCRMTLWRLLAKTTRTTGMSAGNFPHRLERMTIRPVYEEMIVRGLPLYFSNSLPATYLVLAISTNFVWARRHKPMIPPLIFGFVLAYFAWTYGLWAAILGHVFWNALCVAYDFFFTRPNSR